MLELSSHSLNNSAICWYKEKQTSALSFSHSLFLLKKKKHRGCRGQRWELLKAGWGGGMISQTKCQHTLHLLSPSTPYIHTHTHAADWPLKVQLGWSQVADRALLPDGNSRTLAFPPHSAGFALLTFSFFKQISGWSNNRLWSESGGERRGRVAPLWIR